jgi:hypothetical protein
MKPEDKNRNENKNPNVQKPQQSDVRKDNSSSYGQPVKPGEGSKKQFDSRQSQGGQDAARKQGNDRKELIAHLNKAKEKTHLENNSL